MLLCILLFIVIPTSDCQYFGYLSLRFRLPGRCGLGDFDCGFGHCVAVTRFHDGKPDCPDGSDEWCFIGQIKCGPYCVALHDALGCVFNSKCDGSTKQPHWCSNSKRRICSEPTSFPCKGYGECVRWDWLMDGTKHCIDNSDEDAEYVRSLDGPLRCYYNQTGLPQPSGPIKYIPMSPTIVNPPPIPVAPVVIVPKVAPCILCPPTMGAVVPIEPAQVFTEVPKNPFDDLNPEKNPFYAIATIPQQHKITWPTQSPFGEEPSSARPALMSTEKSMSAIHSTSHPTPELDGSTSSAISNGKSTTTEDPFANIDLGAFFPQDSEVKKENPFEIGESSGSGDILVGRLTQLMKMTTVSSPLGTTSGSALRQNGVGETAHIDIKTGKVIGAKYLQTTTEKVEDTTTEIPITSTTLGADDADDIFFRPRPIIPVTQPPSQFLTPIVPEYGNEQISNQPWVEQGLVPIIPGLIPPTLPYQIYTRRPFPVFPTFPAVNIPSSQPVWVFPPTHITPATIPPDIFRETTKYTTIEEPSYGSHPFKTTELPELEETSGTLSWSEESPGTQHPTTETWHSSTEQVSSKMGDTATSASSSQETETSTTQPITISTTLNPHDSVKAEQTECMTKLMEHLKSKYPEPMCKCDKGQMEINGECKAANITNFKMDVKKACGQTEIIEDDKPYIAISKVKDMVRDPVCIRLSSDDDVVVNMLCNECDISKMQLLLRKHDGLEELSIQALNSTLCSDYRLNDCPWNSNCFVGASGTSYSCICKNGTVDLSNGTGKICDGVPDDEICAMFLGICVITWLLFVLGGLFILFLLCLLCFRLRAQLKQNTIHPETSKVAFQENRKHGVRRNGRLNEPTPHLREAMSKTLGSSALGTSSLAKSFIIARLTAPVATISRNASSKSMQIEGTKEISPIDEIAPIATETTTIMRIGTPTSLSRKDLSPTKGITVETPILSRPPSFVDGVTVETYPVPPRPTSIGANTSRLKDNATVIDLTRTTPPPELHPSESAPSLPSLPLPFPLPVTSQTTTVAEVHQEPEPIKETKEVVMSSHDGQPTMWETFKVLGGNQTSSEQLERQSSSGSLEALIKARYPDTEKLAQIMEVPAPSLPTVSSSAQIPETVIAIESVPLEEPKEVQHDQKELPQNIMPRIPPLGLISLPDDSSLADAILEEERKSNGKPENNQSATNIKLAEMLGVTLDSMSDSGIKDKNDERALEEMATEHITLPNPLEDYPPKFIVGGNGSPEEAPPGSSKQETHITGIDSASIEADPKIIEKVQPGQDIPVNLEENVPDVEKQEVQSQAMGKPSSHILTEMRREEIIITRSTTKRTKPPIGTPVKKSGPVPSSKPSSAKVLAKPPVPIRPVPTRVFVPKGTKERQERHRKEKQDIEHRMKLPAKESRQPKVLRRKEAVTSEEESDPEVAMARIMQSHGGRLEPKSHGHKKGRPPERQLSSISEKSAEFAADSRIEEAHVDYSISAPTTTRLSSDWHEIDLKRRDFRANQLGDVDMSNDDTRSGNIVSSPDIPDVTTARSAARMEHALESLTTKKRWLSKESIKSTSSKTRKGPVSHGSRSSLAVEDDVPSTSRSHRSVIGRKIATRRHEVYTSQSERNIDPPMEGTKTGLYFYPRKAKSQENLVQPQPPWDSSKSSKDSTRESFLPPLSKRSRSLFSVPVHIHKRRISAHSYHSGYGSRGGSSTDLSPIFNENDYNKPPKEELWWGAPLR